MKRQAISFDVRLDTGAKLELTAARVGRALNCTFTRGEYENWYAQVADVFGLELALVGVYGVGGKEVTKLVGDVTEEGFLHAPDGVGPAEYDEVDISPFVADILKIRTDLEWYLPTDEDYDAERKAVGGFDDWLGQVEPRTTIDEEEEFPNR